MKFLRYILICLLLVALASCSDSNDMDDVNEKTLLVYYPWSGSDFDRGLFSALETNLRQMENAIVASKGLDGRRVLVLYSVSTTETNLYELLYDESELKVERSLLKQYGSSPRMSTAEGMTEFFNDAKTLAPALNYAFITGGHGCGWVSADAWENYPLRSFGSITDFKQYGIDVSELADAANAANVHFQYILFDNCYMANIETVCELQDACNFLIASPIEIMSQGLPYSTIFSQLVATVPDYRQIVSLFTDYYSTSSFPYGALSVIDCRQASLMTDFMKEVNEEYPEIAQRYQDSLRIVDGFTPNIFYDLRNYVVCLSDSDSLTICQFDRITDQLIRSSDHTERGYTAIITGRTINIDGIIGLTISDPSTHPTAVKSKGTTKWWKLTH